MSDETIVKRMKRLSQDDQYAAAQLEFWDERPAVKGRDVPAFWRVTIMRPPVGGDSGVITVEASTALKALDECAKAVREHKKKESPAEQRRL